MDYIVHKDSDRRKLLKEFATAEQNSIRFKFIRIFLNKMNNYDDFSGSILGTKQYWEDYYNHELKNFVEFGDRGETWFGKLPTKQIITWIVDNIPRNGLNFLLRKFVFNFFFSFTKIEFVISAAVMV